MVLPQITCRTFGVRVFIRVPSPAARMMTAAGPLALTRLLGIGAGKRLEAPPAGSRSGLPQDTASPGGTPRDGQSRARRPGTRPGHGPARARRQPTGAWARVARAPACAPARAQAA